MNYTRINKRNQLLKILVLTLLPSLQHE